MKVHLLIFSAIFSLVASAQDLPINLNFIKNKNEYSKIQNQIHEQMRKKIIRDHSSSMYSFEHKTRILEYLANNRPEILSYEVEFNKDENHNTDKKVKPRSIYFVWGYNRAWHGKSDMTFRTSEGNFTIHDAEGVDRPTPFDPAVYFNPTKLSIPQYVMKVGYMFDENFGIEFSQDHMKWVFVNDIPYEITGDFSPVLYTDEEGEDYPVANSFEDIRNSGNATWLHAEHSDGYNYVNASAVFNINVVATKNEIFKVDFRPAVGAGLMVPKTKIMMHRDQKWNWEGLDNRFHIAGYGVHAEAKVRITLYNKFFIEAAARGTYIKIDNALVDGSNARLEHTAIPSLQVYGAAGIAIPLGKKKKKRKKPIL
jgi:hypothetical protein